MESIHCAFSTAKGLELANLTQRALHGGEGLKEANIVPVVRDEYLAWAMDERKPLE
jgi:hypothetical protein